MENMQEYVMRKLKEPAVNVYQVAIASGVKLRTVYNIMDGRNALFINVSKLNDYFKKSAD